MGSNWVAISGEASEPTEWDPSQRRLGERSLKPCTEQGSAQGRGLGSSSGDLGCTPVSCEAKLVDEDEEAPADLGPKLNLGVRGEGEG